MRPTDLLCREGKKVKFSGARLMNWSSLQVETVGAKPKLGLMCVPLNLIDTGTVFSYLTIFMKKLFL